MSKKTLKTICRTLFAVLVSALFLSAQVQATTVTVHVAPGGGMSFSPNPVFIAVGDTVEWVWDFSHHSVTSGSGGVPSGDFDSDVQDVPFTFSHTFLTQGSFPYFCQVHTPVMVGMVHVGVTPSPTPTATATATATATPTATATVGATATATATVAATATATATVAATATATATATVGGSATPTATATATSTATVAPSPTPTPVATPSILGNISTRLRVETGDNALIGGFIISGTQPKKVIVRAIGPSLSSFFPGVLADPILELHAGSLVISDDNWRTGGQETEIIATGIPPADDLESAIVATLPANNSAYTAIVRGVNNTTGIGVVEAYDLDQTVDSKLANISTRGLVQTGDNVMIGGLIVLGQNPLRVLLRAIGPSLSAFGIPGALPDPTLELHDGNGALIVANDNWRTDQEAEIIATGIPPANDLESAIVRNFTPGNYTAIVRGANNTTGVALVEAYGLN